MVVGRRRAKVRGEGMGWGGCMMWGLERGSGSGGGMRGKERKGKGEGKGQEGKWNRKEFPSRDAM